MNSKFHRRRFIQGAGSLVAIPLLESLFPVRAFAAEAGKPNLAVLYFPFGIVEGSMQPTINGNTFTLPATLSRLNELNLKNDILMPTRLTNAALCEPRSGGHCPAASSFMTGLPVDEDNQRIGISIDRRIANELGLAAKPASLVVAPNGQGDYDGRMHAKFSSNISWNGPDAPCERLWNLTDIFNLVYPKGGGGTQPPPQMVDLKARRRKSVLDKVMEEARSLASVVSKSDQLKLEEYLNSVRETEVLIGDVMQPPAAPIITCDPNATAPGNINATAGPHANGQFGQYTKAMLDLMVLAFSCGRTRIVSYMMDYEAHLPGPTGRAGSSEAHHTMAHYGNDDYKKAELTKIVKWYCDQFAYLVDRLKKTNIGGDQTLLDNSIIVFGCGIHDGNGHKFHDMPVVVAGRGGGLVPGRVIRDIRPMSDLWVSVAQRMGATNIKSLGNSTGGLPGF